MQAQGLEMHANTYYSLINGLCPTKDLSVPDTPLSMVTTIYRTRSRRSDVVLGQ